MPLPLLGDNPYRILSESRSWDLYLPFEYFKTIYLLLVFRDRDIL